MPFWLSKRDPQSVLLFTTSVSDRITWTKKNSSKYYVRDTDDLENEIASQLTTLPGCSFETAMRITRRMCNRLDKKDGNPHSNILKNPAIRAKVYAFWEQCVYIVKQACKEGTYDEALLKHIFVNVLLFEPGTFRVVKVLQNTSSLIKHVGRASKGHDVFEPIRNPVRYDSRRHPARAPHK